MDKQSIILIALELGLKDVLNLCNTNSKINEYVCKNSYFWINKLQKDFNFTFLGKPTADRDPKEYYLLFSKNTEFWRRYKDKIISKNLEKGNRDFVLYILNNRGDALNYFKYNHLVDSLRSAAKKDDDEIVALLKKYQASQGPNPLLTGYAEAGNLEKLKQALSKLTFTQKRFVNYSKVLEDAIKGGNYETVKYFLEYSDGKVYQDKLYLDDKIKLAEKMGLSDIVNLLKSFKE